MEKHVRWIFLSTALLAAACIPSSDYTGPHDMNWTASLSADGGAKPVNLGGRARVTIHQGPGDELLVDLGPGLCRLSARYVAASNPRDWPYFDVPPQHCWLPQADGGYDLMVGGTGTYVNKHEERMTIALIGSFQAGAARGGVDWQFSEAW